METKITARAQNQELQHSKPLFIKPDLLLVLILGCGAILRWFYSNQRGLTYDDTFSYFLSIRPLADIVTGTAADTMPPLYYFLLHYWMKLGQEIWFLRSLNILISLATVFLLYRLIREIATPNAGLWAAFFASISPFQIYHAQDIRMYAVLAFAQLGYIWCFWRLFFNPEKSRDPASWAGLVVFGALAMYSHNLAVVPLVTANLILIFQRRWRDLLRLFLGQLGIFLLSIPWLLYLPGQIAKVQHAFWTPRPGLIEVLQTIVYFHSNWPLVSPWISGITILLSLQVVAFVGFEFSRLLRKESKFWIPIGFVVIPPVILFIGSYLMRPVFVTRVFIESALVYEGLLGILIASSKVRIVRIFVAAATVACAIGGLPDLYGYANFPRSPFLQAGEYLRATVQPGDVIVHDNKLSYFPTHFFAPDLDQQFIADEPGSFNDTLAPASADAMRIHPVADVNLATGGHTRIYFVVFSRAIQEYRDAGKADHPVLSWLKQHYRLEKQQNFNDLEIYTFVR